MDSKSSGPSGAKPTQAKPLGVDDIPGAISPEEAASSGQGAVPAAGGQRGARGGEISRLREGIGGGGAGGQQGAQLARLRAMLGRSGGDAGGGGDPLGGRMGAGRMGPGRMGGREVLEQLKSRLNTADGGENNQRKRLAAAVNLIAEDYARLEQEVERLKGELADAEEKIRILNYEDQ
jgi:hypothetical protein